MWRRRRLCVPGCRLDFGSFHELKASACTHIPFQCWIIASRRPLREGTQTCGLNGQEVSSVVNNGSVMGAANGCTAVKMLKTQTTGVQVPYKMCRRPLWAPVWSCCHQCAFLSFGSRHTNRNDRPTFLYAIPSSQARTRTVNWWVIWNGR